MLGAITAKVRSLIGSLPAKEDNPIADMRAVERAASRWLRNNPSTDVDQKLVRSLLRTGERLLHLTPEMYRAARMTQEQIAENCKRLRADYCTGTLRDTISRFVPRPVGPRVAYMRVPEHIDVRRAWREASTDESKRSAILDALRQRMQTALDTINREHPPTAATVANPFV